MRDGLDEIEVVGALTLRYLLYVGQQSINITIQQINRSVTQFRVLSLQMRTVPTVPRPDREVDAHIPTRGISEESRSYSEITRQTFVPLCYN